MTTPYVSPSFKFKCAQHQTYINFGDDKPSFASGNVGDGKWYIDLSEGWCPASSDSAECGFAWRIEVLLAP